MYSHVPDGVAPTAPAPSIPLYARLVGACRSLQHFHLSGVRLYRPPAMAFSLYGITPKALVRYVWLEGHRVVPSTLRVTLPNVEYLRLDSLPGTYRTTHVQQVVASWRNLQCLYISLRNSDTLHSLVACASLQNLRLLSFETNIYKQALHADDRAAFITPLNIDEVTFAFSCSL